MKPLDPRLLRHAGAMRVLIAGSVGLGGLSAVLVIGQAVLLADVLAAAFLDGAGLATLAWPVAALAAVVVLRATVAGGGETLARRGARRMTGQLRSALLRRVVDLGPAWRAGQKTGELGVLATSGIDALEVYAARYLPQLVLAALVPLAMVAWLLAADPLSGVIVAMTLPLVPVFMALVGLHTSRRTRRRWRTLQVLSGHFLDVVAGLPTLKVFGRAKAQADAVRRMTDDCRRATMSTLRLAFLSSLVLELVSTLSVALVAVSVGLRLVDGGLELRTALAVLILAPEAYFPLRAVGAQFHASVDGLAAAERVLAILETPVPAAGTLPPADPSQTPLRVRGAEVRYAGRDGPALPPTDVVVRPGRITAVVGPSGCGKSTLLMLLAGLIRPDAGQILIGTNDLTEVNPAAWRNQVAWMSQHPKLLPEFAECRQVVAGNGQNDSHLPALGEGGGLSVGERQRAALDQVFRRDAPLVLLDEPTSALDADTERRVLTAIAEHARGRTVVLVTHRRAPLTIADDVIDLSDPRRVRCCDTPQ